LKRKLISKLLEWKEQTDKKPLLITGAKGVGKTYLAYDFGKSFYDNIVYFNFETEPEIYNKLLSQSESDSNEQFRDGYHFSESDKSSILAILDDYDFCQDKDACLTLLRRVFTDCDLLCICNSLHSNGLSDDSFYKLCLYPLDFEEFLTSIGDKWYIDAIIEHYETNKKLPDIVHNELLNLLELYLMVGGMPLAVNEYMNTGGFYNVPNQHSILLNSYLADKQAKDAAEALKIRQIIGTIPAQLYKQNKKFQFTLIRRGATQTMYAEAMENLIRSGYGIVSPRAEDTLLMEGILQNSDEKKKTFEVHNFKLYMLDVGILHTLFKKDADFEQTMIRKGMLDNYIAQSLIANGYEMSYWESASSAQIDFIIRKDSNILPIEVWSNEYTRSKNISILKNKCKQLEYSIKVSTRNFHYQNDIKYVPLYAVFCI
jgi:predicted AAA+ superfamily ATPase